MTRLYIAEKPSLGRAIGRCATKTALKTKWVYSVRRWLCGHLVHRSFIKSRPIQMNMTVATKNGTVLTYPLFQINGF